MRAAFFVVAAILILGVGCTQYDLSVGSATAVANVITVEGDLSSTGAFPFPELITFDGSQSYAGSTDSPASNYQWTWYEVPEDSGWDVGSSDGFSHPKGEQTTVTPPVVGTYMASLTAAGENTSDSVNLAVATGFAINMQGLEVRLSWDKDTTDMDLHLINGAQVGGSYWTGNDCYFGNPTPDWGLGGEGIDNPNLVYDVDDGYGPESINIVQPAAGTFAVAVTYHNDWDTGVTATPQVTVYEDGTNLHTFQGSTLEEGQVQIMGTFDWPFTAATDDGSIESHTGLGGDPYNQT